MANKDKRKRRLKKRMKQWEKNEEKRRLDEAWRNIFVKKGILKPRESGS